MSKVSLLSKINEMDFLVKNFDVSVTTKIFTVIMKFLNETFVLVR